MNKNSFYCLNLSLYLLYIKFNAISLFAHAQLVICFLFKIGKNRNTISVYLEQNIQGLIEVNYRIRLQFDRLFDAHWRVGYQARPWNRPNKRWKWRSFKNGYFYCDYEEKLTGRFYRKYPDLRELIHIIMARVIHFFLHFLLLFTLLIYLDKRQSLLSKLTIF